MTWNMLNEITKAIAALPAEQQREWKDLHGDGEDSPLSLRWETSHVWTPEHREAVAVALHDWVLEQSDAREVLRTIARADRRVGVWLACACARTALRYVSAGEDKPRLAIETAERWVRGLATEHECRKAAAYAAARAAASAASAYAAAYAAASAAYAITYAAASDDDYTAAYDTAACAANAYAYTYAAYDVWTAARNSALRDLCQTIALSVREAIDAAAEGYDHSQLAGA